MTKIQRRLNGNDFFGKGCVSRITAERFVGSNTIDCSSCSNSPVKLKVAITNPWRSESYRENAEHVSDNLCFLIYSGDPAVLTGNTHHRTDEEPLSCLQLHLSYKPFEPFHSGTFQHEGPTNDLNGNTVYQVLCRHLPRVVEMSFELSCRMNMSQGQGKDELVGICQFVLFFYFNHRFTEKSCCSFISKERSRTTSSFKTPLNPTSPLQRAKLYEITCDSLWK